MTEGDSDKVESGGATATDHSQAVNVVVGTGESIESRIWFVVFVIFVAAILAAIVLWPGQAHGALHGI